MLKKLLSVMVLVVLVALPLSACGTNDSAENARSASSASGSGESNADTSADLGEPVSLMLGESVSVEDYRGAGAEKFAALCSELSGGNITITTFPSETLTTSQNAMKEVSSGAADMATGSLSFSVSEVPALAPLDIPGMYDPKHYRETIAEIRPILDEILATQNVKPLIFWEETETVFYLNNSHAKEVHSPADIKGLRLRDHGTWIGKAISAWGASPMTIVPADLSVALERGTVDGGFTGWAAMMAFGCVEPAPNITFPGLSESTFAPIMINLDVWNSLTPTQQDIMTEAALQAEIYSDGLQAAYYDKFATAVNAANGTIYQMTPEETQVFIDATTPLIEEARNSSGDLGNKLIDKFLEVRGKF